MWIQSDKKLKNVKKRYKSFFSARRYIPETENSVEGIYPSLEEAELENSLGGTYQGLREIMDKNLLQKLNKAKDMSDQ